MKKAPSGWRGSSTPNLLPPKDPFSPRRWFAKVAMGATAIAVSLIVLLFRRKTHR